MMAAIALIVPNPAAAQFFKGSVMVGGKTVAVPNWEYDTQNAADGSLLDPTIAAELGLGTFDKKTGVFTAPKGTATKKFNNGTVDTFCFPKVTVGAIDSKGKNCTFEQTVYVVMDLKGANKTFASNTLNQGWINGVMGAQFGAGAKAFGRWPIDPTKVGALEAKKNATALVDAKSRYIEQTFKPTVTGGGHSRAFGMVYDSLSSYTFLTQTEAKALHLTGKGLIDLAKVSPETLHALLVANVDQTKATVFNTTTINYIDLFGTGSPADRLTNGTGTVLILPNSDSAFGILGNDFVGSLGDRIGEFGGASPNRTDVFTLAVPEPASLVLLVVGATSLCIGRLVARKARRGGAVRAA
jgi:hypothetical protein